MSCEVAGMDGSNFRKRQTDVIADDQEKFYQAASACVLAASAQKDYGDDIPEGLCRLFQADYDKQTKK